MRTNRITLWRAAAWLVVWGGLLGLIGPASAQTNTTATLFDFGTGNPLDLIRQRLAQSTVASPLLPMEGALDPETYRVGPGDFFAISIGGFEAASSTPLPVTADGHLILPDAGSVMVAGRTLAEARTLAVEALHRVFRNVSVDVTLAQPRQFYVHVAGAVPLPGRYLAMPVARVSSVLELAFSDTLRAPVGNLDFRPSLRNITLTRRDGTTEGLDLIRYFVTGDTEHNPYLGDGDVVNVPAYDPAFESVYVDGEVPFPGAYDHRPGETVLDLVTLAAGPRPLGNLGNVRLTRRHDGGRIETQTFTIADLQTGTAPALRARDHVAVGQDRLPGGTATVDGFVHHPGTYPIEQGTTTLRDLLDLAGGVRPEGTLRGAYLERLALSAPKPTRASANRFETTPERLDLARPDTLEVLQRLRLADLDFLSRVYFVQDLRLQNRVSVDLEAALADAAAPIVLRDGDRLVVPREERTVYVFGQVIRPGFVAHQPGQPAQFYIDAAGGRSSLADDVYVIAGSSGETKSPDDPVASGDLVFVDRSEDIADSPELQRLVLEESRSRADARIRTTQAIAQTLTALASVAALIISLSRN